MKYLSLLMLLLTGCGPLFSDPYKDVRCVETETKFVILDMSLKGMCLKYTRFDRDYMYKIININQKNGYEVVNYEEQKLLNSTAKVIVESEKRSFVDISGHTQINCPK